MRRRGLPATGETIIDESVAHWQSLDTEERARLLDTTDWLLRRKHWEAAGGIVMDDRVRVVIAAQASLLLLGLSRAHYRYITSIIVYPSAVISRGERAGPAGTRTNEPLAIHGLAADRTGPVLIAWDQAEGAARHPEWGHNVVYHEFAHKIDTLDGLADGTPPLDRAEGKRWVEVCTPIFKDIRAGVDRPPLRPYGGTNPAEFFAVATEAFFDTPSSLRSNEPELYDVLVGFYNQDPGARDARASHS